MSMLDELLEAPPQRQLNPWQRFVAAITAMECDLLSRCGDRDLQESARCFWLLVGVALYQTIVFASLAHQLLAEPGVIRPLYIVLAFIPALVVMLLEAALIIAPSYLNAGLATLERSGLEIPGLLGRRVRNGIAVALRLTFALACAQLGAIAITLPLLDKDSATHLEQVYRKQNVPIFTAAATRFDANVRQVTRQRAAEGDAIAKLRVEEEGLRRANIDPLADEPQLAAQLARIERLRSAKATADQQLSAEQRLANDELTGRKTSPFLSGRVGYGPFRRAADERVRNAQMRYDRAAADLAKAETDLVTLRDNLATVGAGKSGEAQKRLAEVTEARAAHERQFASLDARVQGLIRDREQLIRAAVEADTAHAPREDGILARARAVRELIEADWSALMIVLLFDVVLFFIEVAVLLSKTFAAPTTYSTLLAYQHVVGGHRIVREIARQLNEDEAPTDATFADPAAEAIAPEIDLSAEATAVAEEAPIDGPALDGAAAQPEASAPEAKRARGRPRGSTNRARQAGPGGPFVSPPVGDPTGQSA